MPGAEVAGLSELFSRPPQCTRVLGLSLSLSRSKVLGSLSGVSQGHWHCPLPLDILRPLLLLSAVLSGPHLDFEKGRSQSASRQC